MDSIMFPLNEKGECELNTNIFLSLLPYYGTAASHSWFLPPCLHHHDGRPSQLWAPIDTSSSNCFWQVPDCNRKRNPHSSPSWLRKTGRQTWVCTCGDGCCTWGWEWTESGRNYLLAPSQALLWNTAVHFPLKQQQSREKLKKTQLSTHFLTQQAGEAAHVSTFDSLCSWLLIPQLKITDRISHSEKHQSQDQRLCLCQREPRSTEWPRWASATSLCPLRISLVSLSN